LDFLQGEGERIIRKEIGVPSLSSCGGLLVIVSCHDFCVIYFIDRNVSDK